MILRIPICVVALQTHVCSDVLTMGDSILDRIHETLDIALALIQTLAGEWVDGMCRVAKQSDSLANIGICVTHLERKGADTAFLNGDDLLWDSLGVERGMLVSPVHFVGVARTQ